MIFWGVGTVEMTVHFTICTIVDAKFIQNPDDKSFLPNVELEALKNLCIITKYYAGGKILI